MTHNFNEYGQIENHDLNQLIDLIVYNHNIDNIFADEWLLNFFNKSDKSFNCFDEYQFSWNIFIINNIHIYIINCILTHAL